MSIDLAHDSKTGKWSFSYKRHIFVAVGLLFVASGLATFSGPWWLGILLALLDKADIVINDKYQWLLGGSELLIGIIFLGYKYLIIDKIQERIATDKRTFINTSLDINSVRNYLTNLLIDHSFVSSQHSIFVETFTKFLKPEYSLQHDKTNASFKAFSDSAKILNQFVVTNFLIYPNSQTTDDYRYCLAPHMNFDRDMQIYDADKDSNYKELTRKLHIHTTDTQQKFNSLIEHIKNLGHI